MIAILFGRELGIAVAGNPIAEDRDLSFELATFVFRVDPVENVLVFLRL